MGIYSAEVIDTIGDVRGLLDFSQEASCANSVETTCRKEEEIALMRLIGIGMNKINLLYIIQNGLIGLISTALAFGTSRLCLVLMGEYVASMGIVLDSARVYPPEIVIMAVVFVISVLPTVVCTLHMSRKDGISES